MSLVGSSVQKAEFAIIGGTGVYDPELFQQVTEQKVFTPYGPPSPFLSIGEYQGKKIVFLPRHGRDHSIPPHKINYRANIFALKQFGVERIISISSVGSLQEGLRPGEFVFPDQFIDRTKNRPDTFFDGGITIHISSSDPFCPELRQILVSSSKDMGVKAHDRATYVCVEGPRFSTRSESKLFRQWDASVVGMTLYPECVLAREAQICYASLSMITDYDVWADKPVSAAEVASVMGRNVDNAKKLVSKAISSTPRKRGCMCGSALDGAVI